MVGAGSDRRKREPRVALRARRVVIDDFISIERFESLTDRGKLLSLSFWRDEASVARWRTLAEHRHAQARGRAELFDDYRLRVAAMVRDYGMQARDEAPGDSRRVHDRDQGS